jgi:hypothetical protein
VAVRTSKSALPVRSLWDTVSETAPSDQPLTGARDWDRIRAENWPWVIAVSTVGVEIASLVQIDPLVRAPLVLWFCLVCTGLAWVRLLRIADPLPEAVASVALSVALSGLVAGAFLYAGRWSPSGTMLALEAMTLAAVVLDLRIKRAP